MKIYIAQYKLWDIDTGKGFSIDFSFRELFSDYEKVGEFYISKNQRLKEGFVFENSLVSKGVYQIFEKPLLQDELAKVEKTLKAALIEKIEQNRDEIVESYNKKIEFLRKE